MRFWDTFSQSFAYTIFVFQLFRLLGWRLALYNQNTSALLLPFGSTIQGGERKLIHEIHECYTLLERDIIILGAVCVCVCYSHRRIQYEASKDIKESSYYCLASSLEG